MKLNPSNRTPSTTPDGHLIRELIGIGSMNVSKYSVAHIVAPAGSVGVTRQNQFDEIIIVIKGRGIAQRAYAKDDIGPNDVLLLPAGIRYSIEAGPDEELEFWALCVPAFRPEWSKTGEVSQDWRDYQVARGNARLRPDLKQSSRMSSDNRSYDTSHEDSHSQSEPKQTRSRDWRDYQVPRGISRLRPELRDKDKD